MTKKELDVELDHAKDLEEKFYSSKTKEEQREFFIQFLDCFNCTLALLDELCNNEEISCYKMSFITLNLCDRRDDMRAYLIMTRSQEELSELKGGILE